MNIMAISPNRNIILWVKIVILIIRHDSNGQFVQSRSIIHNYIITLIITLLHYYIITSNSNHNSISYNRIKINCNIYLTLIMRSCLLEIIL